jgi:chromosome partitioning protein
MPVLCLANQKGGVGKTTTTVALAEGFGEQGKRVLLIDWDPQACLTITVGINPDNLQSTTYDVLASTIQQNEGRPLLKDVILPTANASIDIAPSNIELSQAQLDLVGVADRELVLRKMIQPVRREYDFILIDCLPSLGLLTINALSAADKVIIPLQSDFLAMKGLMRLLGTIIRVQERINPELDIAGILFTMTSARTLHCQEVMAVTRRAFGDRIRIFKVIIPMSVRFKEAPAAGQSILSYAPNHEGAQAYRLLTEEVMKDEKD